MRPWAKPWPLWIPSRRHAQARWPVREAPGRGRVHVAVGLSRLGTGVGMGGPAGDDESGGDLPLARGEGGTVSRLAGSRGPHGPLLQGVEASSRCAYIRTGGLGGEPDGFDGAGVEYLLSARSDTSPASRPPRSESCSTDRPASSPSPTNAAQRFVRPHVRWALLEGRDPREVRSPRSPRRPLFLSRDELNCCSTAAIREPGRLADLRAATVVVHGADGGLCGGGPASARGGLPRGRGRYGRGGDAFVAGFLSGRLRGGAPGSAGLANACGACADVPGDLKGLPRKKRHSRCGMVWAPRTRAIVERSLRDGTRPDPEEESRTWACWPWCAGSRALRRWRSSGPCRGRRPCIEITFTPRRTAGYTGPGRRVRGGILLGAVP